MIRHVCVAAFLFLSVSLQAELPVLQEIPDKPEIRQFIAWCEGRKTLLQTYPDVQCETVVRYWIPARLLSKMSDLPQTRKDILTSLGNEGTGIERVYLGRTSESATRSRALFTSTSIDIVDNLNEIPLVIAELNEVYANDMVSTYRFAPSQTRTPNAPRLRKEPSFDSVPAKHPIPKSFATGPVLTEIGLLSSGMDFALGEYFVGKSLVDVSVQVVDVSPDLCRFIVTNTQGSANQLKYITTFDFDRRMGGALVRYYWTTESKHYSADSKYVESLMSYEQVVNSGTPLWLMTGMHTIVRDQQPSGEYLTEDSFTKTFSSIELLSDRHAPSVFQPEWLEAKNRKPRF